MRNKKYTPEDIWAMFAENSRLIKEMRESQKQEADRRMQEDNRRMQEADRRMLENDRLIEEMRESRRETDRRIQETNKQLGGIGEDIGDHAEQYFQNAFAESLTFGGQKYNEMIANMECKSEDGGTEFDIVLINGKSIAIIEVKSRVKLKFVKTMATEKIGKFRKHLPLFAGLKAYLGIAGFSFSKKVLAEAEKQGICIIRQVGQSMEMSKYGLKAY